MANKNSDGNRSVLDFLKDLIDHPQVLYIDDLGTSQSIIVLSPADMTHEMVRDFLMSYCFGDMMNS